jgi:hypothetical protein
VKRALEDGSELDDDPRRVDLEAVWVPFDGGVRGGGRPADLEE